MRFLLLLSLCALTLPVLGDEPVKPKTKTELLNSGRKVRVLLFTMEGCPPCRQLKAGLDKLDQAYDGKKGDWVVSDDATGHFQVIHNDHWPAAFRWFGIKSCPTVVRIEDGRVTGIECGAKTDTQLAAFYLGK